MSIQVLSHGIELNETRSKRLALLLMKIQTLLTDGVCEHLGLLTFLLQVEINANP